MAMDSSCQLFRMSKFLPLTLRSKLVFNGRDLYLNPLVLLMSCMTCEITLPLFIQISSFLIKKTIITIVTEDEAVSRLSHRTHLPYLFLI